MMSGRQVLQLAFILAFVAVFAALLCSVLWVGGTCEHNPIQADSEHLNYLSAPLRWGGAHCFVSDDDFRRSELVSLPLFLGFPLALVLAVLNRIFPPRKSSVRKIGSRPRRGRIGKS